MPEKQMAKRPTCKECVYYVADKQAYKRGTCHLKPPVLIDANSTGNGLHEWGFDFPLVAENTFCGEWEPSDTYLHQRGLERVENYLHKHRRAFGR